MSRAFKFRVWDTRWSRYHSKDVELLGSQTGLRETYEPNGHIMKYRMDAHLSGPPASLDRYDRERFVLEQFTGLLDSNMREIWEGDIVRWSHPMIDVGAVEYVLDGAPDIQQCFWGVKVARFAGVCAFQSDDEYEMIGNIHENSELLQPTKT